MESLSVDILRGLYCRSRGWALAHGSWCHRPWEIRSSLIWVGNDKACACKPQSCGMQDKRPGVVIMQFCIFSSLCCVESTTYKKGKANSFRRNKWRGMFTLHFPFYLLQEIHRFQPVPYSSRQLLVDFYHHRLVLPIFGLHRNGKIHSMQLSVMSFYLTMLLEMDHPCCYIINILLSDFISPEHTTVGHSADVSLKLQKKFVG